MKLTMIVVYSILLQRLLLGCGDVGEGKAASFQDDARRSLQASSSLRRSFLKFEGFRPKILLEGGGYLCADLGLEAGESFCSQKYCVASRPFLTPPRFENAATNK